MAEFIKLKVDKCTSTEIDGHTRTLCTLIGLTGTVLGRDGKFIGMVGAATKHIAEHLKPLIGQPLEKVFDFSLSSKESEMEM